jgi:hypothetical protein
MRTLRLSLMGMLTLALLGGPSAMVVAQDDPMAPAMVTGTATMLSYDSDGTLEFLDNGATLQSGVRITHEWEASDPRLSGTSVFISNWQRYGAANLQVDRTVRVVENDDGRWVGAGTDLWGGDGNKNTETVILTGEGAYEGLTAYVIMAWNPPSPPQATFDAAIFPGEMPPFPDLPAE